MPESQLHPSRATFNRAGWQSRPQLVLIECHLEMTAAEFFPVSVSSSRQGRHDALSSYCVPEISHSKRDGRLFHLLFQLLCTWSPTTQPLKMLTRKGRQVSRGRCASPSAPPLSVKYSKGSRHRILFVFLDLSCPLT